MWVAETIVLGLALAMDAFAVTIANAFSYPGESKGRSYLAPVAFAVFQGLMPAIGFLIGSYAAGIIMQYHGIVTLAILGIIGGKMVYDGIKEMRDPEPEGSIKARRLSIGTILLQAVATSIDALAVGVTYAGGAQPIAVVALVIALTTLAACTVAWLIGRKFGTVLGARAQVAGGAVLIAIGLKALLF